MLMGAVMNMGARVSIDGRPEDPRDHSLVTYATAGFFETMGLQIRRGRGFTTAEQRPPVRVVIVNERFTKKFGGEALGRVIQLADGPAGNQTMVDAMIVGIVVAPPNRALFSDFPNVFYPAPLLHEPALDLLDPLRRRRRRYRQRRAHDRVGHGRAPPARPDCDGRGLAVD